MAVTKGFDFSNTDSIKSAENNEETEHFYRFVKAGESIQVGLLRPSEYAQVEVYDVYPILKGAVGKPEKDLFVKAKQETMRLADIEKAISMGLDPTTDGIKQATDNYKKMSDNDKEAYKKGVGAKWYNLIKEAYRLAEQVRFLFAFYDFNTGSTFVIQTTKKQAEGIYKKIAEAWTPKKEGAKSQAEKYAFTITKGTGGFALDVDTDEEISELSDELQGNHKEYREQTVSEEQFSTAHYVLSDEAQIDAIRTFAADIEGFDFSNVLPTEESKEEKASQGDDPFSNVGKPIDISDDDLPF